MINVSWDDITTEYLPWLSLATGKSYRLLTEAQWEYAARGVRSSSTPSSSYWWGDRARREYANYGRDHCCAGHKEGKDQWESTAPVGQFPANPFGLHDMHGNVWEWVEDCWHDRYDGAPADASAWTTSCVETSRVLRGGSWIEGPGDVRSAWCTRIRAGRTDLQLWHRLPVNEKFLNAFLHADRPHRGGGRHGGSDRRGCRFGCQTYHPPSHRLTELSVPGTTLTHSYPSGYV